MFSLPDVSTSVIDITAFSFPSDSQCVLPSTIIFRGDFGCLGRGFCLCFVGPMYDKSRFIRVKLYAERSNDRLITHCLPPESTPFLLQKSRVFAWPCANGPTMASRGEAPVLNSS